MKKLLFSMTLLCLVSAAGFAQSENVSNDKMKNGSFEIISKTPRGSSSYLLKCIRTGWDFGRNPVISMPKYWTPGGVAGRIALRVIDKNKPGKNRMFSMAINRSGWKATAISIAVMNFSLEHTV